MSAASATIPAAVTLTFLTVAVPILTSISQLAAYPAVAALLTFLAKAASIIDIYAAGAEPEALRNARGALDDQPAQGHSYEQHLAH